MISDRPVCAICSEPTTEGAHVKPRETFGEDENDRWKNIIPLCPNHHTRFDQHEIGITEDRCFFVVLEGTDCVKIESKFNLRQIKPEYIAYKNEECIERVRFRLGIIPGAEYGKL